ncbi:hypothetical protein C8F01DRAFT_1362977 [Mycena amicta]|nr:hypothetical protein C8F01DRAFT_1362977 [Mycena amicta]
MSLQPFATVDLCQASALRGRRRSSIRPQNFLPTLSFTSGPSPLARDESALVDDAECPIDHPTPDELTLSSPKTTSTVTAVNCESYFEAKSPPNDLRLKWRLASALFQYFLNGWGDGVTGTALPFPPQLPDQFIALRWHHVWLPCSNLFLSEMPRKPLGYAFGVWGLGAVVSPLIFQATAAAGWGWAHFYFGSLALAAANLVFLAITFMPTAQELETDRKRALAQITSSPSDDPSNSAKSPLRLVASMPYQWAISIFALFYCGTETTTQGLVTWRDYIHSGPNGISGCSIPLGPTPGGLSYGGIRDLGLLARYQHQSSRVELSLPKNLLHSPEICDPILPVSNFSISAFPRLTSHSGMGLAMQLLMWFIKSTIENGVSASLIGIFYGPIFPVILEVANDLLPVEVHMISMAIISASGSMGSGLYNRKPTRLSR